MYQNEILLITCEVIFILLMLSVPVNLLSKNNISVPKFYVWEKDKIIGHGTMTYANGRVYVGEWKNNKRHGQGTLSYPDGGIRKGIWSSNKLKTQQ